MSVILWIIFGGLVGWIASLVMDTDRQQGAVANVVIGIVGAFVGGLLMKFLTGNSPNSWFSQLIVAIIGAILIIGAWRAITGQPRHHISE